MIQQFRFLKNYIEQINAKGGPVEEDYPSLDRWIRQAHHYGPTPQEREEMFQSILDKNSPSLFNRIFYTPRGYAGSFDIMQNLYNNQVEPTVSSTLKKWDQFIVVQMSSVAVRNRLKKIKDFCHDANSWKSFLDVACGPGLALATLHINHPTNNFSYVGVDQDPDAIAYCGRYKYIENARFKTIPFLSMTPETIGVSDIVWCSGFFDYIVTRKGFMGAARRLIDLSKQTVIIGNMGPYNLSRPLMEMLGWRLTYRTKEELLVIGEELRRKYGCIKHISVTSDDTGIQHYLSLTLK